MGYQDALSNIMPVEWLDPYGQTPFAGNMETSVDITIVETDDGIKASSVKNPPKSGPSRLMQAIQQALGVNSAFCESPCSSLQAADQGKRDSTEKCDYNEEKDSNDKKPWKNDVSYDKMNPSSSSGSSDRDRNLGPKGSPKDQAELETSGSSASQR